MLVGETVRELVTASCVVHGMASGRKGPQRVVVRRGLRHLDCWVGIFWRDSGRNAMSGQGTTQKPDGWEHVLRLQNHRRKHERPGQGLDTMGVHSAWPSGAEGWGLSTAGSPAFLRGITDPASGTSWRPGLRSQAGQSPLLNCLLYLCRVEQSHGQWDG